MYGLILNNSYYICQKKINSQEVLWSHPGSHYPVVRHCIAAMYHATTPLSFSHCQQGNISYTVICWDNHCLATSKCVSSLDLLLMKR
jgi:hypothetical protein